MKSFSYYYYAPTLLLLLLIQIYCRPQINAAVVPEDELNLSLNLGSSTKVSSEQQIYQRMLETIMNDDVSEEFNLTGQTIQFISKILEDFAQKEQIDPTKAIDGHAIAAWLAHVAGGHDKLASLAGKPIERTTTELDFIYANFWSQFVPLITKIITEKPANLGPADLAYRCEKRESELRRLKEMSSVSNQFSILFDVFANELYSHCLKRKLATIEMNKIKPTPIVQQFVDIYLDVPVNFANAAAAVGRDQETKQVMKEIMAGLALQFDLKKSLEKHGSLQSTAPLVLDFSANSANNLVERFKFDCEKHVNEVGQVWSNYDQVSLFLSSDNNNLAEYNNLVKLVAPQLVYATLCVQLASAAGN